ncbi:hypothetical protein AVEN_235861-1 [Araneus ventricosus]|uniref:Uncharacterized protein n=1 Tax=Araneus ventricosus TaxID=182803 RepID=A0A4Y2LMV9_ARAVE|nr:hypothetical protein AVEN_235861-1 [Araneus ventricosus]
MILPPLLESRPGRTTPPPPFSYATGQKRNELDEWNLVYDLDSQNVDLSQILGEICLSVYMRSKTQLVKIVDLHPILNSIGPSEEVQNAFTTNTKRAVLRARLREIRRKNSLI